MHFSDNTLKLLLVIFSGAMFGLYMTSMLKTGDANNYQLIFAMFGALFSYKFSDKYKSKNSLDKLIERKEEKLEISFLRTIPFSNISRTKLIEINRISIASIGKNWLSIIIDGNGNGYDFQLIGSQKDIEAHLKSLLAEEEISNIDFRHI